MGDEPKKRLIPQEILARRELWHRNASRLHLLFVCLACGGALAGILVTGFAEAARPNLVRVLGVVGALCSALIAIAKPGQLGDRYREAWRILDPACFRYEFDQAFTFDELLAAIERGEHRIGLIEGDDKGKGQSRAPSKGRDA